MKINKKKVDLNIIAKELTKLEGGKVEVNIAQMKEILNRLGVVLKRRNFLEIMAIVYKLMNLKR